MRRSLPAITSLCLGAALVVGLGSPAGAATCVVKNGRDLARFSTLRAAVDVAVDGDTLRVRGTCVGTTRVIGLKSLRIIGVPTATAPVATLDQGNGFGRVLRVKESDLVLRDLAIVGGSLPDHLGPSAGIYMTRATVVLRGSTSVHDNWADYGGAVGNHDGTLILSGAATIMHNSDVFGGQAVASSGILILKDEASITDNHAGGLGGSGVVVMRGTSTVAGNSSAYGAGGIILGTGRVTLRDSASITGNTAQEYGGGVYLREATLTLRDTASVTGNRAYIEGGGIYLDPGYSGKVFVCSGLVAISPNDPDDSPPTLPCP